MIGMLKHHARASCLSIMRFADQAWSTDGRTDERHEEITCVTNKSSSSVTRAHVQDFIILASEKRTLRAAARGAQ